jgi:hypothetical protein
MEVEANLPADGAYGLLVDDGTGTMTSVGALTAEGDDGAEGGAAGSTDAAG